MFLAALLPSRSLKLGRLDPLRMHPRHASPTCSLHPVSIAAFHPLATPLAVALLVRVPVFPTFSVTHARARDVGVYDAATARAKPTSDAAIGQLSISDSAVVLRTNPAVVSVVTSYFLRIFFSVSIAFSFVVLTTASVMLSHIFVLGDEIKQTV